MHNHLIAFIFLSSTHTRSLFSFHSLRFHGRKLNRKISNISLNLLSLIIHHTLLSFPPFLPSSKRIPRLRPQIKTSRSSFSTQMQESWGPCSAESVRLQSFSVFATCCCCSCCCGYLLCSHCNLSQFHQKKEPSQTGKTYNFTLFF